jgi:hypothetical protein
MYSKSEREKRLTSHLIISPAVADAPGIIVVAANLTKKAA